MIKKMRNEAFGILNSLHLIEYKLLWIKSGKLTKGEFILVKRLDKRNRASLIILFLVAFISCYFLFESEHLFLLLPYLFVGILGYAFLCIPAWYWVKEYSKWKCPDCTFRFNNRPDPDLYHATCRRDSIILTSTQKLSTLIRRSPPNGCDKKWTSEERHLEYYPFFLPLVSTIRKNDILRESEYDHLFSKS